MRVNKTRPRVDDRVKVIAARETLEDNYLLGLCGTVTEVPDSEDDGYLWGADEETGEPVFEGQTMYVVVFTDNHSEDWDVFHEYEIEVQDK